MFDSFSRSFGSSSHVIDPTSPEPEVPNLESSFGAISSYQICGGCGRFHGATDAGDGGQGVIVNEQDRGGFGPNGKPSLGTLDAGEQITRSGLSWASGPGTPVVVTFAFRDTFTSSLPGDGTAGFNAFSAGQIAATLLALQAWSDVANITFQRVTDGATQYSENATILFGNYTSGAAGAAAFAYLPGFNGSNQDSASVQGDVWINSSLSYNANPEMLAYGQQVLVHEIGHAIGLSHPANYNAGPNVTITYDAHATYFEDSRQYTVMSYFSERNTGADFRDGVGNNQYSAVPLLDDIAAAQRLYGANMTTRTGDTVYGFNSNAGQPWFTALNSTTDLIFAVWDAGGTDTFDFSGYSMAQTIDLRQGCFSSVGGLTGNIAIAIGVVIENVVGGTGADVIRGNSAGNIITGNGGADQIDGGLGSDTVVFSGNRSSYTITWNGQVGTVTAAGQAPVTITNVEFLQFADTTIAATPTGGLVVAGDNTNETINGSSLGDTIGGLGGTDTINGLGGADTLNGGSGNDNLNGGDGDDVLIGALGDDALNGGAGFDVADYSGAGAGVNISLATGTAAGAAGNDTLVGIEEVRGTAFTDNLTGDGNANVLRGGGGIDTLSGGGGADQLFAGDPGETGGAPDIIKNQGTANNAIGTAVSLMGGFDLGSRPDVANASTIPHATVVATAHGGIEYYAITVQSGETVTIDIDGATFDSVLRIYTAGNVMLTQNDDSAADGGAPTDSGLTHTFLQGGTYYIQVSQYLSGQESAGTLTTTAPPAGQTYNLHVSLPSAPVVALQYVGATLNGDAGADVLTGGVGRDTLNGGADNDTLIGGGGNDVLNGGAGTDTAVFTANRSAYTISVSGGVTTVTGADGTDTVSNVERLQFADGLYNAAGEPVDETVEGTPNADTLTGTASDETLNGLGGDDVITGGLGNDTIDGGTGTDTAVFSGTIAGSTVSTTGGVTTVSGPDGTDTLTNVERLRFSDGTLIVGAGGGQYFEGTAGANSFTGTAFNDELFGLGGNDTLNGAAGADLMVGGAGNDIYVVDNAGDVVTELASEGTDEVRTSIDYTLGAQVENLSTSNAAGTGAINLTGNTLANTITGNAGANSLNGGSGDDVLNGLGGADILDGGGGADTMNGGAGDDLYYVNSAGDVVVEAAGGGMDEVRSAFSYTLTNNAEIEVLGTTNAAATTTINLSGNNFNNTVTGNAGTNTLRGLTGDDVLYGLEGNDTLDGGVGRDTAAGGLGDDTYQVDNAQDVIVEAAGEGFDIVRSAYSYTLTGTAEVEVLQTTNANLTKAINLTANNFDNEVTGNAGANRLRGLSGDDVLIGLGGDDVLDGGVGTDTAVFSGNIADYSISTVGNVTTVSGADGTDTLTAIELLQFADGVVIVGGNGGQYFEGGAGADTLTGSGLDDLIHGLGGDDILDGGAGADRMVGGLGNDLYYVDDAGDIVTEAAGEGSDEVRASVSYTLANGAEVETLSTTDAAGTAAINLTGNSFNNTVTGNAGANTLGGGSGDDVLNGLGGDDVLNGGAGADAMAGGLGDDRYYVDDAGDVVTEVSGEGVDEIRTSISYTLANGLDVENLMTTNTNGTAAIDLTGNSLANTITGNAGANTLSGGSGDDTLAGMGGDDILNGGGGRDFMVGGDGNDLYYVDNIGDVIAEFAGGGVDEVRSAYSYTLTANAAVEILGAADAAATNALNLTGNGFDNTITGNAGVNQLKGMDGDDVLNGLGGADTLIGGSGNDIYYVDNIGDLVTETVGGGIDEVRSAFSYTLSAAAEVEILGTTNAAATNTINLNGNGFDNAITGNAGTNSLRGYDGDDVLTGLAGNDTLNGGNGTDTAVFSGLRSAYTISTVGGVTTVTGPDGTDTLTAIELLMFDDGLHDLTGNPLAGPAPTVLVAESADDVQREADDAPIGGDVALELLDLMTSDDFVLAVGDEGPLVLPHIPDAGFDLSLKGGDFDVTDPLILPGAEGAGLGIDFSLFLQAVGDPLVCDDGLTNPNQLLLERADDFL